MSLWDRLWVAGYDFLGTRCGKIEEPYRRRLVEDVTGDVIEIGSGTGFNFPYYRELFERSGLRIKELDRFDLKGAPAIVRPHALGVAAK